MKICDYEVHPAAACAPLMSEQEFDELAESIKEKGLHESIMLLNGTILDGRHRYRACKKVGVDPHFEIYRGDDPIGYVVLKNKRRNLTASQKAAFAAAILELYEDERKQHLGNNQHTSSVEKIPHSSKGKARDDAARAVGVNAHYVSDAKRIKEEAPEIFEDVKAGKTTIAEAKSTLRPRKRKPRGSFDQWKKFKSVCATIRESVSELAKLTVDTDHIIDARNLAEKLSAKLQSVANNITT